MHNYINHTLVSHIIECFLSKDYLSETGSNSTPNLQLFQVPKLEVLNLTRLFWVWWFPCIGRIHTAYIRWGFLYSRYLNFLVTQACFFGGIMGHVPFSVPSLSKKNSPSASTFQQVSTQKRYSPKILPGKFRLKKNQKKNYRIPKKMGGGGPRIP